MLLLILAYCVIALAVVTVVVSAGAVHLARHRLLAVADGAALDAAGALDRPGFYASEGPRSRAVVPLTDASVLAAAEAYVGASPAARRLTGLRIEEPTGSPDGATAEVSLVAVAELPVLGIVTRAWAGGVTVRVTARARARRLG